MLSDEQIHDCFQQQSRDKKQERRLIANAIEAEVRKQDTELIRQMKDALEDGHDFAIECVHRFAEAMQGHHKDQLKKLEQEAERIAKAINAARARLENT